MRDHLREQDIERRLGVTAGEVTVSVADDGTTTVTLKRDHLDSLVAGEDHHDCVDIDAHHDDLSDTRRTAYQDGYDRALADVNKLAGAA